MTDIIRQPFSHGPGGTAVTAPISPACDTGRHLECARCDCTCHPSTTQYQPPSHEGDAP